MCSFMSIIFIHFLIIFEDSHMYTLLNTFAYVLQVVIIFLFMVIHDNISYKDIGGLARDILLNLTFWLTMISTTAVCIVPFYLLRRAEFHFSGNIIINLRQKKFEHDYARKYYQKKLQQMTKATRSIAKFKRLYKLNQDNLDEDNYADKQMKLMVDEYKTKKSKIRSTVLERTEEAKINIDLNRNKRLVRRRSASLKEMNIPRIHNSSPLHFKETEMKELNSRKFNY